MMNKNHLFLIKLIPLVITPIHIIIFIPFIFITKQLWYILLPEALTYYLLVISTFWLWMKRNYSFVYAYLGIVICTFFMGFLIPFYLILIIPESLYAYFLLNINFIEQSHPSFFHITDDLILEEGPWINESLYEMKELVERTKLRNKQELNKQFEENFKKYYKIILR
ncbi:MAG: hypothetical protein P8Y97_13205 [Candidatus Lokiarchaeota archaeon]